MNQHSSKTSAQSGDAARAGVIANLLSSDEVKADGRYVARLTGPREVDRTRYCRLRDAIAEVKAKSFIGRFMSKGDLDLMEAEFNAIPLEVKWVDDIDNLITTVGKNKILDEALAASAYTAAWYMGLISLTSYSAVAAADTMGSHAGWLEAGSGNNPTYSQGARPTTAWSAAASGAKALSSALSFSITSTGTAKGCFVTSVATKDGTTGVLLSAGLFTGGDKAVANGDTLSVSYTATLT